MKELKALYDAIVSAKEQIPAEVWAGLVKPLKTAGLLLHTTHSFVYRGKLKADGRAVTIKLPGVNMDFDDVCRLVCGKPNGPLDHFVDLRLTVFDNESNDLANEAPATDESTKEEKDAAA